MFVVCCLVCFLLFIVLGSLLWFECVVFIALLLLGYGLFVLSFSLIWFCIGVFVLVMFGVFVYCCILVCFVCLFELL